MEYEIGNMCEYIGPQSLGLTYKIPILYMNQNYPWNAAGGIIPEDSTRYCIVNERELYSKAVILDIHHNFESLLQFDIFRCGGGHGRMFEILTDWPVWEGIW